MYAERGCPIGDGVIVCVDRLRVGLLTPEAQRSLCASLGLACEIAEVEGSGVFCEVIVPGTVQRGAASRHDD